ncbi:hypothetical protein DFH06DRAFT_1143049 [Mycena polygramma]|nr:hypothetical protein DFH06DRAFT_1143049 [Mycena polygramma]
MWMWARGARITSLSAMQYLQTRQGANSAIRKRCEVDADARGYCDAEDTGRTNTHNMRECRHNAKDDAADANAGADTGAVQTRITDDGGMVVRLSNILRSAEADEAGDTSTDYLISAVQPHTYLRF